MNKSLPFVSVCTPTFNRRPFIPIMFEIFKNQTYPVENIEWIIVDDGTDKIEDLVKKSGISQIKYFALPQKIALGKKRNFTHSKCRGDIIVYMDDDDYYPPARISHAVNTLMKNPTAQCCGSSEIYTYFNELNKMFQFGPYGPNHATAGTFAFRKELLKMTQYNENETIGEERYFLKDYTIPFVQLDPMKTILVFSHSHNTFDKNKMLENPNPQFAKESEKTADDFIQLDVERNIKEFFLHKMKDLLLSYDVGHPSHKPDVLAQIKAIDEERRRTTERNANHTMITMHKEGEDPVHLNASQVVQIIQNQQQSIEKQNRIIQDLQRGNVIYSNEKGETISLTCEEVLHKLKKQHSELLEKDNIIQNLQKQLLQKQCKKVNPMNTTLSTNSLNFNRLKSEPEVRVVI